LLGVLNLTGTLRGLQERFIPAAHVAPALAASHECISSGAQLCKRSKPGKFESSTSKPPLRHDLEGIESGIGVFNVLRPLVIGTVHGLAGSAAVAILVMTTIHDPWWAIAYLLLFGVGTVAGMMLITAVIAMPFAVTGKGFSSWNRRMAVASG